MTQSALDQVALDRAADGLAHDETRTCRGCAPPRHVRVRGVTSQMDDQERATRSASAANRFCEVLAPPQPILGGQHGLIRRWSGRSGGQTGAALAAAGREDRATGAGAHTQAEAVGLRATAVVRLEGALAHSGAPDEKSCPTGRRLAVTVRPRKLADRRCTALTSPGEPGGPSPFGRQAAAAIDNSTSIRYVRLGHPVKPARAAPPFVHTLWTTT